MKRKKIIIWTVVILLIAGAGGGYYAYQEYNRKQKDTADLKADFTTTATAILDEYGKDEKTANAKYFGKVLKVDGLVKDLIKDDKGYYSVVLGDTASMSSVRFSMDSIHNAQAATLVKGTKAVLKGICTGYNADEMLGSDLILNRAVIEKN
jgi:tRNA_anti-like